MNNRERHGFRLRTLVFAVLLIPTLMTLSFGALWIGDRQAVVDRAERVAVETSILADLSRIQFGLESKQLQATFLASKSVQDAVEPVSTPPTNTQDVSSKALKKSSERLLENAATLDRLSDGSGSKLITELLNSDLQTDSTTISDEVVAALPAATGKLRAVIKSVRSNALKSSFGVDQSLTAFTDLQTEMTNEARGILNVLTAPKNGVESSGLSLFIGEGRQNVLLDQLTAQMPRATKDRLVKGLAFEEMALLRQGIARQIGLTSTGPTFGEVLTPDFYPKVQARYFVLPSAWSDLADQAAARAAEAQRAAQDGVTRAIAATFAVTLFTIALGAWVARRVSRRLGLLAARAGAISHGEIEAVSLPTSGPRELREATGAFNTMSEVLDTLHRQIEALSTSSLDDDSLTTELPGRIGADIQRSVSLLAETNAQLRSAEELAGAIIDSAMDSIITLDDQLMVRSANPSTELLTGLTGDDLIGRHIDSILSGLPDLTRLTAMHSELPQLLERTDGTVVSTLITGRNIEGSDGNVVRTLFIRDVSGRELWEARFRHQATHDELTGLPNRIALQEHLDDAREWIDPRAPITVVSLNLNRFRLVNDILGHSAGDRVLRAVAERLVTAAGADGFTSRVGGNEFVIVTQAAADSTHSQELAAQLGAAVSNLRDSNLDAPIITASIGVAFAPSGDAASFDLVRLADIALLHAKANHIDTPVLFDEQMSESIAKRSWIETNLRTALATDALEMYAQPIVDIASGTFTGVELLARWRHEGGFIPPDIFIPIAEEAGLISELGRWAMKTACQLLEDLHRANLPLLVSVNISGLHLMGGEVANELAPLLAVGEFDPTRLKVELTESVLLTDPELAADRLAEIRDLGPKIFIDDFGTGFSSLTYLHRLPIDGLKLDRSFVTGIGGTDSDDTIVRLVHDLAVGLGLDLIAEGIETEQERGALEGYHYQSAQGYLFARPMPISDLWAAIQDNSETIASRLPSRDATASESQPTA